MIYTLNAAVSLLPIRSSNDLKYSRFKSIARDKVYRTLKSYYAMLGWDMKSEDLRCHYALYSVGIITDNMIEDMIVLISDKPIRQTRAKGIGKVQPVATVVSQLTQSIPDQQGITKSLELVKYTNSILNYIKTRTACSTCNLKRRGFFILDTNRVDIGPVDIMFISDGVTEDEIVDQAPGLGSRNTLIELCNKYDLKYVFANLTMCNINRVNTAKQAKDAIETCSSIFAELEKAFPTTLSVLVGDNVRVNYGIKGGRCNKLNGKSYGNKIVTVSYDKLEGKALETFVIAISSMIEQTRFQQKEVTEVTVQKSELSEGKTVSAITPDLILYDIKEIGDDVVYIFTNGNDEKVYYTEKLKVNLYYKPGNMIDCEYVTPISDGVRFEVNARQLKQLRRKFYTY